MRHFLPKEHIVGCRPPPSIWRVQAPIALLAGAGGYLNAYSSFKESCIINSNSMNCYYIDTNIWIDFWEDRSDGLRPLGEFAFRFFKHAMENKELVFYSELVFEELRTKFKAELIEKQLFKPFSDIGILRKAEISRKQMDDAVKLSTERHVPKGDALHAILARDNNAVLVSRDAHYEIIQKFIKTEVRKPEELY